MSKLPPINLSEHFDRNELVGTEVNYMFEIELFIF